MTPVDLILHTGESHLVAQHEGGGIPKIFDQIVQWKGPKKCVGPITIRSVPRAGLELRTGRTQRLKIKIPPVTSARGTGVGPCAPCDGVTSWGSRG